MIVPVQRRDNVAKRSISKHVICNAEIPLCYLKKISNGALKSLAQHLNIITIEDLHTATKELILDKIKNRSVRKEVFELKEKISTRALVKKHVIKFEDFAMGKRIRISPLQRAYLIAVSLFKEILKDIKEVLVFVLGINQQAMPFRQQALLRTLYDVSFRALKAV